MKIIKVRENFETNSSSSHCMVYKSDKLTDLEKEELKELFDELVEYNNIDDVINHLVYRKDIYPQYGWSREPIVDIPDKLAYLLISICDYEAGELFKQIFKEITGKELLFDPLDDVDCCDAYIDHESVLLAQDIFMKKGLSYFSKNNVIHVMNDNDDTNQTMSEIEYAYSELVQYRNTFNESYKTIDDAYNENGWKYYDDIHEKYKDYTLEDFRKELGDIETIK